MGNVIIDLSMSLDGYICDRNGGDGGLHNWYFAPSTAENKGDQLVINETINDLGAIIMGKRTFSTGEEQGGYGDNPYKMPHFVITHHPPEKPVEGDTQFIFVTDGIESALKQAKAAAGDKDIAIGGGADISQQYLKAGLVDLLEIHLVHILLGSGLRLFENLGINPIDLESTRVIDSPTVTHLQFRVVK
ncbi:MAG: dihydrofolate reductase family protein [Anaerolineae bacterium]|nr:dihydrofolate reductase family protein [Anaerolineae bacterium]